MKSFFHAGLMVCLLHASQLHAEVDCGEAKASSIWMATEERLAGLFDIRVSTPPKFVIYKTVQDLPKQSGDMVIGYYDHDSKEISVACYDGDTTVFSQNVRHESTHYYLHAAYARLPNWLNEGLAAYMEEGSLNEGAPREHLNKQRLDEFIHLLRKGRVPPLTSLWEGRGFARPSQYYAACWALVFALLHHENSVTQASRRNMLHNLLKLSSTSQDPANEIHQYFKQEASREDVDLEAWQTRWHRQIWSLR